MLRATGDLTGYTIAATDGDIGSVMHFFFDDHRWTVRHIVVDLGNWLPGRRVLLSPVAVERIDESDRRIVVRLTKEKIRTSPDVDTERPVSRQQELALHEHYGYGPYWGGAGLWGAGYHPAVLLAPPATGAAAVTAAHREYGDERQKGDPHLRSTKEVAGYHLCTPDGEVGHVDDFVFDEESWAMRYLVLDTSNWPGGRRVVVPVDWVKEVDWARMQIRVDASADAVRQRPEFRDGKPRVRPAHRDAQKERRVYHINDIIGKSVVTTGTGEKLGTVADALLDTNARRLVGFVVGSGMLATEHVLPLADVQTVGRDAVLVRTTEHMMDPREWRKSDVAGTRCSTITGRRVVSEKGEELGQASDLLVDERTGALDGIEVSEKSLGGLRHRRRVIAAPPASRIGPDAIIVADDDRAADAR